MTIITRAARYALFSLLFVVGVAVAQPLSQQVLLLLDRTNVWTALQTFGDVTINGTCTGCGGAGGGTVTSVAMTVAPAGVFDIAGTPIVGAGTLALTMDTQADNIVFAGPNGGGPLVPAFRALVDADIPDILTLTGSSLLWSQLDFTVSSLADITTVSGADITSGKVALARLTTGGTVGQALLAGAVDPTYGALDLSQASAITGQLVAASFPILTGDITTAGGSLVTDLSSTGVAAAVYGSTSTIPQLTIDDEGRVTLASNLSISTVTLLDGSRQSDTVVQTATRGSIIVGVAGNLWDELTVGAAGTFPRSDGTDITFSTDGSQLTALDAANLSTNFVALARGGSGASLTASFGSVVYSTATAWAHTAVGTVGQCLTSNAAAAPTWGACATLAAHNLLSATHGDTVAAAALRGAMIVGDSTPNWSRVAIGPTGSFWRSDGTDPAWSTDGTGFTALDASDLTQGTVPLGRITGLTNVEISAAAGIEWTKLAQLAITDRVIWAARGGIGTTADGAFQFLNNAGGTPRLELGATAALPALGTIAMPVGSSIAADGATAGAQIVTFMGEQNGLTDAGSNDIFTITTPDTEHHVGGNLVYTIMADDGTETQARSGYVTWTATLGNAVFDSDIATALETVSISTGTLTGTWAITHAANVITISLTPTSSLTPTTLKVQYHFWANLDTNEVVTLL